MLNYICIIHLSIVKTFIVLLDFSVKKWVLYFMKDWIKIIFGAAARSFCLVLTIYLDIYAFRNLETRLLAILIIATLLSGYAVFSSIRKIIKKAKGTYEVEEDYYDPDEHFW